MFANKIPNHTLALIPEGDHNFKGHFEEVTDTIIAFFEKHELDSYAKTLSMGQNTSLIIPRWIDIDGAKNFRDIGGWPLKDGSGYIRERTVFRSGQYVYRLLFFNSEYLILTFDLVYQTYPLKAALDSMN